MARNIQINPVLNGFIVNVGCQTVVVETPEHLGHEITRYYKNPEAVEKEYRDKAVNREGKPELAVNPVTCQAPRSVIEGVQEERMPVALGR